MSFEYILQISSGLLTPLIAIVAVYIALQQWWTNRNKLKLDLYDRRFQIYEELEKMLGIIIRDGDATYDQLGSFYRSVEQADFLFGPEIVKYLKEIYQRGVKLHHWREQYRDLYQEKPEGYDHSNIVENEHNELLWLVQQVEPAKTKFKKYLYIKN